ncbi:hemerythrin domain-containing protein [Sphingomonas elodea]|uniref:hemerythrin domain-containing protein n=1 Tax=Sphingomonas elodea TaxID=179878 RepID=UPI0002631693|nr:hemerythrin domain-containing protein [Sphingomonas elodea]
MATTTEREPKRTTKTTAKDTAKPNTGTSVGVIAGAVAGGAALGLLAMLGRKAAVQAPSALAGNWDDALKAEHKAVLKAFDTLEATDDKATIRRNMLLAHIKHALVKHAIEEENVIYPALREAGKTEQADELNAEHGYVKQFLYELENMPSTSPRWLEKVKEFRAALEKHIREEEDELFPELRAQLSEEKNKAITLAMNKEGFKVA